jgi:hypothetical protein
LDAVRATDSAPSGTLVDTRREGANCPKALSVEDRDDTDCPVAETASECLLLDGFDDSPAAAGSRCKYMFLGRMLRSFSLSAAMDDGGERNEENEPRSFWLCFVRGILDAAAVVFSTSWVLLTVFRGGTSTLRWVADMRAVLDLDDGVVGLSKLRGMRA